MNEKKENGRLKSANAKLELIGKSGPFLQMMESVKQVAPTNITVLITGESGTGKEMVAKAIHELSPRKDKPMLTVNCGAIPEGILESELFGHEKGSFTGAVELRKGYFELADGGSLFLDEIGEMPLSIQVKLLRVLEEKNFIRVGGSKQIQVNVRLITATNRDLGEAVRKGEFRQDLYYRVNAIKIQVPPLRVRREDVEPLAIRFAEEVCRANKINFKGFEEDAFQALENHSWPGNIRELRNLVERIIVLERGNRIDGETIKSHIREAQEIDHNLPMIVHKTSDQAERELIYRALIDLRMMLEDIRSMMLNQPSTVENGNLRAPIPQAFRNRTEPAKSEESFSIKEMEKRQIMKALDRFRRNRRKAAKELGIGLRTLYRKLKEYDLEDY
jgi:transcriptional regulator with PAS, ATPase and Fis domain